MNDADPYDELYNLTLQTGKLLRDLIVRSGRGDIHDMIGYGQKKYGEELIWEEDRMTIYYCDYYNILEVEEGEPLEELADIPKIKEVKLYLEQKFAEVLK